MNKKQLISVLAIILVGALLAAFIVFGGKPNSNAAKGGEEVHAQDNHADDKHAANEHAAAEDKQGKQGKQDNAHKDEDEHKNEQGGDHAEAAQKIAMQDAQMTAAGITTATAAPGQIRATLAVPGQIRYNEDKTAHIVPRLAGVVERVSANLGQSVKRGQVLAVIASTGLSELRSELLTAQRRLALARVTAEREKKLWQEKISAEQDHLQAQQAMQEAEIAVRNAQQKLAAIGATAGNPRALANLEIRAPFDGMIMEKHIALGEAVKEDATVFTISNLSEVWAEVDITARDIDAVRVGEKVVVKSAASGASTVGRISYVGSLFGEQTRTAKAHIVLANPEGAWRPGLFVTVDILAGQTTAPVAVAAAAIQSVDDKPIVFLRVAGGFLPQAVTLGVRDADTIAVTKGLKAGDQYAAKGSFTLKSELGKSSVEHAH